MKTTPRSRRASRGPARALLAAALALPALAGAQDPTGGTGNICEDQIRDFVARNFDQTVNRVQFRYQTNLKGGGNQMLLSQGLAFPNECPGYHFFDVIGDDFTCERQARIGGAPTLVTYRSSGDGC